MQITIELEEKVVKYLEEVKKMLDKDFDADWTFKEIIELKLDTLASKLPANKKLN